MTPTLSHSLRQLAIRLPDGDANLLWRAAIHLDALQGFESPHERAETLQHARDRGEKECLLAVLLEVSGNRSWAADRLRISRTALYKFLRKHGLKPPRK